MGPHDERVKLAPVSQNLGPLPWASQGPGAGRGTAWAPQHPLTVWAGGDSILPDSVFRGLGPGKHPRGSYLLGSISTKLTGDLLHGEDHLPWRGPVGGTIPWGAVQVWVPNHVQSHQPCTTLMNLGELGCLAPCLNFSPEKWTWCNPLEAGRGPCPGCGEVWHHISTS